MLLASVFFCDDPNNLRSTLFKDHIERNKMQATRIGTDFFELHTGHVVVYRLKQTQHVGTYAQTRSAPSHKRR